MSMIEKLKCGPWRYNLTVSLHNCKSTMKHSRVDVGVKMSAKFAKSTLQKYKMLALQTQSVNATCSVYHTKIQKLKGGRWCYILNYSALDICKVYLTTIQKCKGEHWRYKLTVSLQFATFTIQRHKIQDRTLAVQTYGVP